MSQPRPVRPHLCDKVHAALVEAGRPVTRRVMAGGRPAGEAG